MLNSGQLSSGTRAQAQRLLERVQTGVRILLVGPPGVGKSRLCNVLLGQQLDEKDVAQSRVFYSAELDQIAPEDFGVFGTCIFTRIETDVLGPVILVDAHPRGFDATLSQVLDTALASIDVVIWCTQSFTEEESAVWAQVPDALKDHSFLVLTKADKHCSEEELANRLEELQDIAETEFHRFFPTTTKETAALLRAGTQVTDAAFASSGVKALREALRQLIKAGCRADLDQAAVFLERFGQIRPDTLAAFSTPMCDPPKCPVPSDVRDRLIAHALDLAEKAFDDAGEDMTEVLGICSEISEDIVDALSLRSSQPALSPEWAQEVEEASDKVMMLGAENNVQSAADAVTILLQLRRDLDFMKAEAAV